jgi:PadR family transcriptional regulator, regulatory protein PadR
MDIPRLPGKEAEILRLLIEHGEMYGLEMVKASPTLKRGTIYVTLGRMSDKGFVESRAEPNPDGLGPARRRYRVTGHGARVFRAWNAAAATLRASWAT